MAECIVCRGPADEVGLLTRCSDGSCGALRWNKSAARKITKTFTGKEARARQFLILDQAGYTDEDLAQWGREHRSSVYVLRLRGGLDRVYVGMTGLHPVQRYLQHVTGYKASSVAKRFATALIYFESDMTSQEASDRERSLHQEYLDGGFDALGGH